MAIAESFPRTRELSDKTAPRYDLSPQEANKLCADFLETQESKPNTQLECYRIDGSDKYANLGRFVEGSVFMETFGNTPDMMAGEYGPYEDASRLYVVVDHETTMPVGVMRTIVNSEAGLKTLADLPDSPLGLDAAEVCNRLGINPDRCVDVGTLAILPDYRGGSGNILPSLLLYRSLYVEYLNNPDFDNVITIIDKNAEKNLFKLNFPFRPVDERYFMYLDSKESRLLYGINKEFYPSVVSLQKQMAEQAEASSAKAWYAQILDSLAHGTYLDEMIPYIDKH